MSTLTRADTTADTITAGLYGRVSTTDQNVMRQHAENMAACQRRGWRPAEYADEGLSASRFAGRKGGAARKDYGRLLADLSAGRLGVLILWEASRGDRQLAGWATLLDTCRRFAVLIYITSEDYLYDVTRPRDWKALAEAGVASAMESETLSLRIRSGKDAGVRAGRPQGSIPYGVRRVRDPLKSRHAFLRDEPDPVTGPVAAKIIKAVGDGEGYAAIAEALNAEGAPTARGGRWHGATVHKIAANAAAYVAAGVVTEPASLRARARLADPGRKGERASRQQYRYTGVLRCSVCGEPVRGARRSGAARYLCPAGHVSIQAAEVDQWIDTLAVARLSEPDLLGLFDQADDKAASAARAEAARHRQKIADAAASYAAGNGVDLASLEAITATLSPLAEAAERRAVDLETPSALRGLADASRAVVARRWAALTVSARKSALRILAPGAEIRPGKRATVDQRVVLWPEQ